MDINKIPSDSEAMESILGSVVDKADHGMIVKEATLKTLDSTARTVKFIASTEAVDSDGDIVEQVWDLKRFKSNPVILFGHNSKELPIGKADVVGLNKDGNLEIEVQFASEKANPRAEQVFQLVQEGVLRAVSVGFRPKDVRFEKREEKEVLILSNNELMEVSVVPIPSNPEALAKMKQKAMSTRVDPKPVEGGEEDLDMELQKQLDEANDTLKSVTEAKALLETRCSELEESLKVLTDERNEKKAADTDKELKALIGVKISPNEVDTLKELSVVAPDLYSRQLKAIKSRSDMPVSKKDVLGSDNVEREPVVIDDSGQSLDNLLS